MAFEKTFESPLDCKIKPVNPKGNQYWIFLRRTDAEAETPILWPPDAKNWLIRKDNDAGKDWRQEEKGTTEDEMVGWHHQLNGHEFEQALGDGEGQGSLVCCSSWGHKELDMTEQLNNNNWWLSGKESTCQCRGHGFDPWSRKTPHAMEQLSPITTTFEPVPQSSGAATPEPTCCKYWSLHALEHVLHQREAPAVSLYTATREKPPQPWRPSTAKNK